MTEAFEKVYSIEDQNRDRERVLQMDLEQEQAEEDARLEDGRRVTQELTQEFRSLLRKDLLTVVLITLAALCLVGLVLDMITSLGHALVDLYNMVHTWLTAHK